MKIEIGKKLANDMAKAGFTIIEEIKYFGDVNVHPKRPKPKPKPKPKRKPSIWSSAVPKPKQKRKAQWYSDTEVVITPKMKKLVDWKSNSIVNVLARNLLDYVDQSHITLGSIRDDALLEHGFTHQQLIGPLNTLRDHGCLKAAE